MMASFEKIKLVHEEKIIDKIRKFSVLGYPRKEIGELLDEDLDIFVQELLNAIFLLATLLLKFWGILSSTL